ncbi:MAG: GTPase HflX [Candidatus Margulisiibacteriota bacterium]|nr:GTPase HflX [Candidatus Margulisiibacteriota bacterium]
MYNPEKAVLIGVKTGYQKNEPLKETFIELERLADTAGAITAGKVSQKKDRPDPRYFIGSGKIEEIRSMIAAKEADLAIFNVSLSPSQCRNLETALGVKVVDYTELILDIFAQHAKSREGNLQVELAQSTFRLTRLTGYGVDMSRPGGGIGTRGPGETKLEHDRRRIRKKIADLKKEIEKLRRERSLRREKRKKSNLPLISLVGYTNSGKSTLLNTLTDAGVLVEDKLFATVDTTTRRFNLSPGKTILFTDTVGFINNLPHQLIAAFKATLEEVSEADLLIHVVDFSNPYFEDQIGSVYRVLEELKCAAKPVITVFNKIDLVGKKASGKLIDKYAPALLISALKQQGLTELKEEITKVFFPPPGR